MLPGQNLQFIVLIRGISRAAILEIFTNIVKSLSYAHENGIIHYNVKPSNIIIPEDFSKLKIIDFGLTDVLFFNKEAFSQYTFESPMFCSPEFVNGLNCDIRSDIYSLGVLFYFMFSHKTPYLKTAPNNVIVEHIKNDPVPEIKGYGKINEIIAKATNKEVNLRYQNCQELLQDIKLL
jgi:serine/threonine protein kinase